MQIGLKKKLLCRILDDNRDNFNEDELKRVNLLTRKDIHNIKQSYNIQIQEGVRHNEGIKIYLATYNILQKIETVFKYYKLNYY